MPRTGASRKVLAATRIPKEEHKHGRRRESRREVLAKGVWNRDRLRRGRGDRVHPPRRSLGEGRSARRDHSLRRAAAGGRLDLRPKTDKGLRRLRRLTADEARAGRGGALLGWPRPRPCRPRTRRGEPPG